jgi:hypothetical protein
MKNAVQREIWLPTQHSFWDQGKPRKTLIELTLEMIQKDPVRTQQETQRFIITKPNRLLLRGSNRCVGKERSPVVILGLVPVLSL